jgi:hypothetical protein
MEYALTMDDINALEGAGFNMMGVGEGTPATPQEIKVLGIQLPPAPAPAPAPAVNAAAPDLGGLLADVRLLHSGPAGGSPTAPMSAFPPAGTPLDAQGNPMAAPMQGATMQTANPLASFLQPAPEPQSNDPFANLSRTQRRMLAFSALSDAGAALAGRAGGDFDATLGSFNEMADMQRKREAANAQNEMMRRLLGGAAGGAGAGAGGSVEERRAALMQLLMIPEMVPYAQAGIAQLDAEAAKMASAETNLISTNAGIAATEALLNSPNLDAITGWKGNFNGWLNQYGAAPEYADLMSYVEKLRGLNFLEAYQSLKGGGSITNIESAQATAARSRVDAALAGNVSNLKGALEELNALFQQARERNPAYIAQMQAAVPPVVTTGALPAVAGAAPAGTPATGAAPAAPVLADPLGIRQ